MEPNFYGPVDDIPEAQRDAVSAGTQGGGWRGPRRWLIWFLVGLLSAIAGLAVSWLTYQGAETALPVPFLPMTGAVEVNANANDLVGTSGSQSSLLGHFPYEEADPAELVSVASNATIQLRPAAATNFDEMVVAAQSENIYLVPISGFRSKEDQEYLFFEIQAQRGQTPRVRAEVSAPPGFSEHHTGYAVDIGDADVPDANLSVAFEETAAFEWLEVNGPRYGFELSFEEGNEQGVQYEPWHWRFIGDSDSLQTFYSDR
ncbi:MAG: M15 family metallopeptidase [Cyanobacteria bacterium P01_D01_bin.115]